MATTEDSLTLNTAAAVHELFSSVLNADWTATISLCICLLLQFSPQINEISHCTLQPAQLLGFVVVCYY